MEAKRAGWRAPLPTRMLVAANTALVTCLVATALIEGHGWRDNSRDLWAGVAILWLVVLVGWVLRRLRGGLPV